MQRKILILALLCCSLIVFAQKQKKNNNAKQASTVAATTVINYKILGAPLPTIRMITPKKTSITDDSVKGDGTLFVMLFNPTCEHCEAQTETFKKNIDLFKKTKLVMMAAPMMLPYLDFFEKGHHVSQYPIMMVGVDSAKFIDKTFLYEQLPQINIYDKDRKLVKIFTGDIPFDSLRRYIE